MKKLSLVFIIFIFLFLFCPLTPLAADKDIIRVGIQDNNFSNLYYKTITIGATCDYIVYDKTTLQELAVLPCDKFLKIDLENGKMALYSDTLIKNEIKNPIGIKTSGLLTVKDLKRGGKPALYRGEFEIAIAHNGNKGFNLINVIPLEDYLKGVVPNEMPVRFGLEALKAQAIAARNYTLRPRTKIYHNFDVCDSVQSQVYFGANTEQFLSNKAVEETKGLFALYKGKLILALYSSTAGGFTENYENVFLNPEWEHKIVEHLPYLRGKSDKNIELLTDENIEDFYSSYPDSYDTESKFYRWEIEWNKAELEEILKKTLNQSANSGYISPKFNPCDFGNLENIKILSRGVSGKAIAMEIQTDKETYVIKKELIIRKIFLKNSKMLNSANFIIKNSYDENGNLCCTKFTGGGFGHGVGMSQYGAGKMASFGQKFNQILQHYYTGIAIGTYPITLQQEPIIQNFSSPEGKGTLVIEAPENIENFNFILNDVEIDLDKAYLSQTNTLNLDKYIKKNNYIEFLPLDGKKELRAWIEVYRAEQ